MQPVHWRRQYRKCWMQNSGIASEKIPVRRQHQHHQAAFPMMHSQPQEILRFGRQKLVEFSFSLCYNDPNQLNKQDSYIGNTTASQAVKAGSTPVSCSKQKHHPAGGVFVWHRRRRESNPLQCGSPVDCRRMPAGRHPLLYFSKKNVNRLPYPAPAKKPDLLMQIRLF